MKIEKWVKIESNIEIDLDASDVRAIFDELPLPERTGLAMFGLSKCAAFMGAISDKVISELNTEQRRITQEFLIAQTARYEEK